MSNWFDIAVSAILIVSFISGYSSGAIKMIIQLSIIIAAIIFGGKLATIILPYVDKVFSTSMEWKYIIAYGFGFIIISITLSIVGNLIQRVFEAINIGFINRLIGGIFSIAISMVIMSIILNLAIYLDKQKNIITQEIISKSFFYERVQSVVPAIVPHLKFEQLDPHSLDEQQKDYININIDNKIELRGKTIDSAYQKEYFETNSY